MGAESVRWSAGDLARILSPAMQLTDITGYLVPVADGGWLLPAGQGRVGAPLDVGTYRTVTLALRRYFAVTVVDCECLPGEVARTAMDTAHARVVVAPMTAEGVHGTRQVLDWLARLPHSALASTVVALSAATPDATLDTKAATAHLREPGVTVVPLPLRPPLGPRRPHPHRQAGPRHPGRGRPPGRRGDGAGGEGAMTQRLVHRPARSTRPLAPGEPRTIEPPPNLPEGKVGNAATALLPLAGVISSVVLMTVIRNSRFAVLGAVVLVAALFGAVALFLSQRGKAQRTRRCSGSGIWSTWRSCGTTWVSPSARRGAPARTEPAARRPVRPRPGSGAAVGTPPRGRRLPAPGGWAPGRWPSRSWASDRTTRAGVLTPPDPFMLNEARALRGRFATAADFPLTVPLDRAGNVSVIGERDDVLRVARALLTQTVVTHAPDDVSLALATADESAWAWAK